MGHGFFLWDIVGRPHRRACPDWRLPYRQHYRRHAAVDPHEGAWLRDRLSERKAQPWPRRSEEHTSELQSLMRISYAVFCLKKKNNTKQSTHDMRTHTCLSELS